MKAGFAIWVTLMFAPTHTMGKSLYFLYPDALGPDEAVLNVLPSDYVVFDADKALPASVVLNYNKEEILDRYKISDNFVGFVFDDGGTIQKAVKRRMGNTGVGDLKRMKTMAPGWEYYELRPLVTNNTIYIEKYFGWVDSPPRAGGAEGCLAPCPPEGDCVAYCGVIPRCLGVLRTPNETCLVGNAAVRKAYSDPVPGTTYREKKLRHDVFVWIGKWGWAVGMSAAAAVALQVLVPYGFNTTAILRTIRRLFRLRPRGKARAATGAATGAASFEF
jgi:hypothetical protein